MRKQLFALLILSILICSFTIVTIVAADSTIPLPDNIQIVPPADHVPTNVREFFGATGKWSGECLLTSSGRPEDRPEVRIYFEEISMNEANVIFATEGSTIHGMPRGYFREKAKISLKGKRTLLSIPMPSSSDRLAVGKFWIDKGILKGERYISAPWGAFTSYFTLKPIN